MTRSQRFIFIAIASVVGLFLVLMFSLREPRYHGKTLTYWTQKSKQGNRKEQDEAREGLRAMGKSAFPHLVKVLEKQDSPLKIKILKDYGPRFHFLRRLLLHADPLRAYAAYALGEIGPPASNAIPALLRVSSTNILSHSAAVAALMKIRGEPIDGLIQALDDPSSAQWVEMVQTVAEFGTNASAAVPALCRGLISKNGWAAGYALGFIHSEPEIAVPALMDAIKGG